MKSKRAARLANLGKTLNLPGFRPGKVPLVVVRQRFGSAVTAEVLEESVSEATQQVLSERGLRPAQQPKIDVVSLDAGGGAAKDLEFKVELELLPDIVLPDFGEVKLTRMKAEAAPETTDKALADIAQRNRELVEIGQEELGDRGAATGEVLERRLHRADRGGRVPRRHRQRYRCRDRRRWLHSRVQRATRRHEAWRSPDDRGHFSGGVRRTGPGGKGRELRCYRQKAEPRDSPCGRRRVGKEAGFRRSDGHAGHGHPAHPGEVRARWPGFA